MTVDLNDPYEKALYDAIMAVYGQKPPNHLLHNVNVTEFVEAVKPVVKSIVQDAITDALHPEFGWYWREQEK